MKVYSVTPNEDYSGGVMIIAANTAEEAKKIAKNKDFLINEPKEIPYLTANVDKPDIIIKALYFETIL